MVELVLIGNGFDLAHGFKTKYSDFIDWYIRARYTLYKESGGLTKEDDLIIINKLVDPKYYEGIINYDKLDFTHKHNFFKEILNNHRDSNWEGIERDYFLYLYKTVTNTHKLTPGTYVNPDDYDETLINKKVKDLNACLSIIEKQLIEFLKLNTPKYNSNFEVNDSISGSLNQIFSKCAKDITQRNVLNQTSDSKVVLLNFNYTNTASIYFRNFRDSFNIANNIFLLNIHGNLEEKKSIIFGYGDESDRRYSELEEIGNNDILSNFKSFDYLQSRGYSTLIGLLENQKYNIYIMGHSCGVSDRVLLKELFCSDNCEKIQIYYHDRGEGKNDYKDKTMNISRIFPLDQKAAMRKKIVNFRVCKPL